MDLKYRDLEAPSGQGAWSELGCQSLGFSQASQAHPNPHQQAAGVYLSPGDFLFPEIAHISQRGSFTLDLSASKGKAVKSRGKQEGSRGHILQEKGRPIRLTSRGWVSCYPRAG